MRNADIFVQNQLAGTLHETDENTFIFTYLESYSGPPVSLTLPTQIKVFTFKTFPPFFEGLLPEGIQLDALLRTEKLDKMDYFSQLMTVGADLVGAVTVKARKPTEAT